MPKWENEKCIFYPPVPPPKNTFFSTGWYRNIKFQIGIKDHHNPNKCNIFIEGSLEFRSQTSDHGQKETHGKAEVGRIREEKRREEQRREEKKTEDQRRERVRGKKMQAREKECFFQWFVVSEGPKVSSLSGRCGAIRADWTWEVARCCGAKRVSESKCAKKHHVLGPLLEVEMSKTCTPMWREAHFQVKMWKTPGVPTAFGSWDVVKVHTDVARSTFPSQYVKHTTCPDDFWKLSCRKSARCVKQVHAVVAQSASKSTCTKHSVWTFFWHSDVALCGRRTGFCTSPKVSKTSCLFWNMSQNDGSRGTFDKDLQRCMSRGRRSTRDMFIRDCDEVRAVVFLRSVAFWSIRSSGLPGWFRVTSAALHMTWHHFSWQAQYFRQMEWNNHKTQGHEAVRSALNFPFFKEASQNCFVFDVVNLKNWGCLAE